MAARIKGSLDDRMRAISAAIEKRFTTSGPNGNEYAWCRSYFADYVVFEKGGKLWSIGYSYNDKDGKVTLDEKDPAEVQMTYVPVKEAMQEGRVFGPLRDDGRILEAGEQPSGKKWAVQIIQEGMSKNRNRYSRKVLEAAASLYEGVRIYADHQETPRRFGRSVNDVIGFIESVQPVAMKESGGDGSTTVALCGVAVITKPSWQQELLNCYEAGRPDVYGLSHDVKAKAVTAVESGTGQGFYDVTVIEGVDSVDLVTNPAAGGRLMRVVASDTTPASLEGDERMLKKMIEAIRKSGRADLVSKLEALGAEPTEDGVIGIYESLLAAPAPAPATPATTPATVPATTPAAAPVREAVTTQQLTEATERIARLEADGIVNARRAMTHFVEAQLGACALPKPVQEGLRRRWTGMIGTTGAVNLTEAQVTADLAEQVEIFGKLAEAGISIPGPTAAQQITLGDGPREKMREALDAWFGVKTEGTKDKPIYKLAPVDTMQSFRRLYAELTGDVNVTGRMSEATRLKEALSTASFDQILGDSITRRMVAEYAALDLANWRGTVANVVPLSDFRTQRRMRFGGYGNLPTVSQGAPYTALTSPTDEEATYAPAKRGGTEQLTIEMITNDDVGAVRRIPTALAKAAGNTLHEFVWDMLATNAQIYDSVALAANGHGNNIVTTALSASNLSTLRLRMKQQTDMSSGKRLGLKPRYLIVPTDLEDLAYEITGADRKVPDSSLAAQAAPAAPNPIRRYNLTVIVVEYWTDANDYWLAASLDQTPMIEVGFLNGREDPELFVQDQPTQGSLFSNDVITYKIRHIYGGAVTDYRGFAAGIVT